MLKRKYVRKKKNRETRRSKQYIFFLFCVFLIFLNGCIGKWTRYEQCHVDQQEVEARLTDVPFPISFCIENIHTDGVSYIVEGTVTAYLLDIQTYYITEMERCGWWVVAHVCTEDVLEYIYEKPDKRCVVYIKKTQERPDMIALVLSYVYK